MFTRRPTPRRLRLRGLRLRVRGAALVHRRGEGGPLREPALDIFLAVERARGRTVDPEKLWTAARHPEDAQILRRESEPLGEAPVREERPHERPLATMRASAAAILFISAGVSGRTPRSTTDSSHGEKPLSTASAVMVTPLVSLFRRSADTGAAWGT